MAERLFRQGIRNFRYERHLGREPPGQAYRDIAHMVRRSYDYL